MIYKECRIIYSVTLKWPLLRLLTLLAEISVEKNFYGIKFWENVFLYRQLFFHAITKINSQVVELLFKEFPTIYIFSKTKKMHWNLSQFDHQWSAQGAGKKGRSKIRLLITDSSAEILNNSWIFRRSILWRFNWRI